MSPEHKSKCPSIAPLLQPQRRKFLFGGIGLFVFILAVFFVVYLFTSAGSETFILDRSPLYAGRNNLPQNLHSLLNGNWTAVNLNSDLTNDPIFGKNCTQCNTDIPRLIKGKVSSQFWVARAGCDESTRVSDVVIQLDIINSFMRKYSDHLQFVKTSADLEDVYENKIIGNLIAVDGGQSLMNTTSFLKMFHTLGVRSITLASNCNSSNLVDFIESTDELTSFGKNVVNEMNRLGMMIDIQNLSNEVQRHIMNISAAPVMFSHTASASLFEHPGNIDDITLNLLKANDGLIMITFDVNQLGPDDNSTTADVVKHLNYIVDKIAFDNIAIGGNFDSLDRKPTGLEDVSKFPELFIELKKSNSSKWTPENLEKLAGLNFAKFFQKVEKAKAALTSTN